jgi:hypothetical protein
MAQPVIVNDVGQVGVRTIVNSLIVLTVVAVVIAVLFKFVKKTFQTTQPGQCAPDDYYEFKDPNIHADC